MVEPEIRSLDMTGRTASELLILVIVKNKAKTLDATLKILRRWWSKSLGNQHLFELYVCDHGTVKGTLQKLVERKWLEVNDAEEYLATETGKAFLATNKPTLDNYVEGIIDAPPLIVD